MNEPQNPNKDHQCWAQVTLVQSTNCDRPGSPLYRISKPLGFFYAYLCDQHAEKLRKKGFEVTKISEHDVHYKDIAKNIRLRVQS